MMMKPTSDQCTQNTYVGTHDRMLCYALWSPQMGGYTAVAILGFYPGDTTRCYELWVWHDGEFPSDDPIQLHGCNAEQLVIFGQTIQRLISEHNLLNLKPVE